MSRASSPSILLVHPSSFHYPEWMERVHLKTSLLLLASYLAQHFPVEYADFEITIGRPNSSIQIKRYERQVREFLSQRDFDILAISCWTSLSYQATMATARICRELYPEKLIVVGGYHPTAKPEEFVTPEGLIDYVITSEGELALREIAENLNGSGRPKKTEIVNGRLVTEDHFVPYNWELVDEFVLQHFPEGIPIAYIYLSRGCPFVCAFCMETVKEQKWRAYTPAEAVESLLSLVKRWNARSVSIADACFGMRPRWRREFLERLTETEHSFWLSLETRPEYIEREDAELLSRLKIEVQLGVESCSAEMLSIMQKSKQPEKFLVKFLQASHLLSEYGVMHRANLIFNHPGETRKTLDETFSFIDHQLENRGITLVWAGHGYMHFPGSDCDRNRAFYEERYGCRFLAAEWWKEDRDQYENSMRLIPSSDLAYNGGSELWREMLTVREAKMKSALSDKAFNFAAQVHFPHWKNDPRYNES